MRIEEISSDAVTSRIEIRRKRDVDLLVRMNLR